MTISSPVSPPAGTAVAVSSIDAMTPVQIRDLAVALALSEEVSPCPAAAHTALLILRSMLARAFSMSDNELLVAAGVRPPNLAETPTAIDHQINSTSEANAQ